MRTRTALIFAMLVAISGFLLVSCATAPSGGSASSQADLLTQAGFTLRTADTPQRLA